ncbi:MAG: hypothetical protein NTX86_02530 [Candidatus Dependentiae bacterium]|nr:hypothetical protein [Candidatus Dependentiae bacterium]
MKLTVYTWFALLIAGNTTIIQTQAAPQPTATTSNAEKISQELKELRKSISQNEIKVSPEDQAELKKSSTEGLALLESCNKLSGDAKKTCENKAKAHAEKIVGMHKKAYEKAKTRMTAK